MLVVNQTPFYGEAGGQVGDIGEINNSVGLNIGIKTTLRMADNLIIHNGLVNAGTIEVGDNVELKVDRQLRNAARRNHSATHLLHAALRNRLGEHVAQKGSLVSPERLRFDLSHPKPISSEELQDIQIEVNSEIIENSPVQTSLMSPEDAIASGSLALFGEKYGTEVRVVSMGRKEHSVYSSELCGGTHVGRTGDIGCFFVLSETAVGSGVRRIEAVTGLKALELLQRKDNMLQDTAKILRVGPNEVVTRISALLDEKKKLEKELVAARQAMVSKGSTMNQENQVKKIGEISFLAERVDGIPAKELRGLADQMKGKLGTGVVALISVTDNKVGLVVGVSTDLTSHLDAIDLVRVGAEALGGRGGGGRQDLAQAGGPNTKAVDQAIEAIEQLLNEK